MSRSWRGLVTVAMGTVVFLGITTATPLAWGFGSSHQTHVSEGIHARGNSGTSGVVDQPQPYSTADLNGHGANPGAPTNPNVYRSTRDGSPSLNGNGHGRATGKPCAGCVGKADNKNPTGQHPGGSDHNAGYECDRNSGIGRTNPAHTGCSSTSPTTATTAGTTTSTTGPGTTTTTAAGATTTTVAGFTTTSSTVAFAAGSGSAITGGIVQTGTAGIVRTGTAGAVGTALRSSAGTASVTSPAFAGASVTGARTGPSRSGGVLAFTGSNTTFSLLIALFLVTAGAAATVLARRRSSGSD